MLILSCLEAGQPDLSFQNATSFMIGADVEYVDNGRTVPNHSLGSLTRDCCDAFNIPPGETMKIGGFTSIISHRDYDDDFFEIYAVDSKGVVIYAAVYDLRQLKRMKWTVTITDQRTM